jgi:hypothetical protein
LCFHITSTGFRPFAVPYSLAKVDSSFYMLHSFSMCTEHCPSCFRRFKTTSLRFFASLRHQQKESTHTGFPGPAWFRSRRFSRPQRFPPLSTFAGLFHPTAAYRLHFSGVFPSVDPFELITRRPLLPFVPFSLSSVAQERQPPDLASRGLIPTEVRYATWRFRPRHTRSPL